MLVLEKPLHPGDKMFSGIMWRWPNNSRVSSEIPPMESRFAVPNSFLGKRRSEAYLSEVGIVPSFRGRVVRFCASFVDGLCFAEDLACG
jgi:hypothetical protein